MMLTHRVCGGQDAGLDIVHRRIDACFRFYNGATWHAVGGSLQHFCNCCEDDAATAEAGAQVRRDLLHDSAKYELVPPPNGEKKVGVALWYA